MPYENPWQVGKHFAGGTVTLMGVLVQPNGLYQSGGTINGYPAVQTVSGIWDEIDLTSTPNTEEISASDSRYQHTVILQENFTIRIQAIIRRRRPYSWAASHAPNPLQYLIANYDVMYFICAPFDGDVWQAYVGRGNMTIQHRKGRNIVTAEFNALDINEYNPLYGTK